MSFLAARGFYQVDSPNANPMDVMRSMAVSMLGLYDSGLSDEDSRQDADHRPCHQHHRQDRSHCRLLSPARQGLELPKVRDDLGEAAHFLYLLNGTEPSPEAEKTLDVAYVLHADHGMNASTFSARVTIATLAIFIRRSLPQSEHSRGPFTAAQMRV